MHLQFNIGNVMSTVTCTSTHAFLQLQIYGLAEALPLHSYIDILHAQPLELKFFSGIWKYKTPLQLLMFLLLCRHMH